MNRRGKQGAAEAATRSCPLWIVHAVRPPLPTDHDEAVPLIDSLDATRASAETESRDAALVVVGSRGRDRILGTVLGSASQTVRRHAHCPITVVRHDCATAAEPLTGLDHGRAS
jgi:hypothetical protein